jgi:hypothetical protein
MKNFFILLILAVSIAACESTEKKTETGGFVPPESGSVPASAELTTIEWLDSTYSDLGTVKEGQLVEVSFRLRNSGDKNLVIENVSASCGCTVPEKPEEPIAPGKEQVIKARFDSRGKPGEQHKSITVVANTPEKVYNLTFKVQVNKD